MRVRYGASLVALSWMFAAPQLAAQANPPQPAAKPEAPAAPQLATEVRVAPGALQGKILTVGERLPIAAHSMTLVAGGKPLQTVVTTADGAYHTAPLLPGAYSLMVRDDLQLDLVVAEGAATKQLDILMPQGSQQSQNPPRPQRLVPQDPRRVPAAPGGAGPARRQSGDGIGVGTFLVIGAGVAVAVAAVPVIDANRDSSPAVSPVQPANGGIAR